MYRLNVASSDVDRRKPNEICQLLLFVDTGLAEAGVKLAESVIKEAGIKLEEEKASEGAGGGGTLKIVPHIVHQLSFGDIREKTFWVSTMDLSRRKTCLAFILQVWSATISSNPMP
jgi:hypothetical protein